MYKFVDNQDEHISLHDCRANGISLGDGVLSFVFDNGFWIGADHTLNPHGEPMYTDKSEVRFHLLYNDINNDITIYIFTNEGEKTFREELSLDEFVKMINSGSAEIEFLYEYKGYRDVIFECWLWFEEEPYHKECVLIISTDDIKYCWNEFLKI